MQALRERALTFDGAGLDQPRGGYLPGLISFIICTIVALKVVNKLIPYVLRNHGTNIQANDDRECRS